MFELPADVQDAGPAAGSSRPAESWGASPGPRRASSVGMPGSPDDQISPLPSCGGAAPRSAVRSRRPAGQPAGAFDGAELRGISAAAPSSAPSGRAAAPPRRSTEGARAPPTAPRAIAMDTRPPL